MMVVTTQRARKLAKLQMEFVATVSHELRTPVAAISSAVDNLADGVMSRRAQAERYAPMIKDQLRQLTTLIEQILLFAATREKRHRYNSKLFNPAEVVAAALSSTSMLIADAGVTVEQDLAANLPLVMADFAALCQCLQNLITNAVKYGGESRWMRFAHIKPKGLDP